MGMPKFLLHGLWVPGSGLNLWVEQVEGHRIVTLDKVEAGTFPDVVHLVAGNNTFRHRHRIRLQTPKGRQVELLAPTAALGPENTVRLLAGLAEAQALKNDAIAPDLKWLIRMYQGLHRFVRAGRVSIHVPQRDRLWYAEWQLGTGVQERGWLAAMTAAAPGVLVANNQMLGEDMARTLTHWIATYRLQNTNIRQHDHPYGRHDFINSLLNGEPLRRGSAILARRVGDWNGSITAVNLQLVFIADDPIELDEDLDYIGEAEADAVPPVWPVRVQVRSGTDSPRPVLLHEYDAQTAQRLRSELQRASQVTDLADPVRHPRPHYLPPESDEGDWDLYLTTEDIARFVRTEAAKLRNHNFAVMLPKAWTTMETKAKLHVTRDIDPYDASTVRHLGFDTLLTYDWKVSIGDVELTDAEMRELVRSKSGLVKLRDEWVLADKTGLAKTERYIQQLHDSSLPDLKKRLDAAEGLASLHAKLGHADAAELEAEAQALREEYEAAMAEAASGQVTAAELRQLALESAADASMQLPVEITGAGWFNSLMGGTDRPAPERVDIPETVQASLRDYQRRGVDWLYFMSRNNLGAVLADDMGLGKTLQLLTLLAVEKDAAAKDGHSDLGPTIVVAPTSVVGNWAREAARFVPHMKVLVHHGAGRKKDDALIEAAREADLVITSYGIATRDGAALSEVKWDHVVLDEAQAIKNAGTRASKSVRRLPARQRIALTGTPVENKLSELRSLLDFVNPGMLGSQSFFRNHFAKAIERGDDELSQEMGERLQRLTAPFILRRLKTDPAIIDDLPDKAEHIITVDMTAEQAALYTALTEEMQRELGSREGMARRGLVLSTITKIKQICNHPAHFLGDGSSVTLKGRHRSGKVEKLVEILDQAADSGQRVLIFTQYKAFGDILKPYLSERLGEDIPFLHGGVGKSGRDAMVERFQAPDGPQAMLLSLKAGGTGLNLTAASIVVHMDRWWNPAVENQATDRAFRIGQQRDVTVYKMITRGTMEERIQEVLDGKMHLAGAVVGEGEGWITELNAEDLAQLMSYRGRND